MSDLRRPEVARLTRVLLGVLAASLAGSLAAATPAPQRPARHPNILFILTDQHRQDALGAYGNREIRTPNLDALARKSVVFERCYVSQPVCTPSRGTLLTGLYPHSHGSWHNDVALDPKIPTLPELAGPGYVSGYVGKWHLGDEVFRQRGFALFESTEDGYANHFGPGRDPRAKSGYHRFLMSQGVKPDSPQGYSRQYANTLPKEQSKPAYIARAGIRFIDEHKGTPFILYLSFLDPHTPFNSVYDDLYSPAGMKVPETFREKMDPSVLFRTRATREVFDRNAYPSYEGILRDEAALRAVKARYWGKVTLVDEMLGRVFTRLRELGLEDDTIVVFTTDHGEMMGDHRLMFKSVMYEESIRVPMLLRLAGADPPALRAAGPVSHIDLVPTLLDLTGQPRRARLQGRSWASDLRARRPPPDRDVIVVWDGPDDLGNATRLPQYLSVQEQQEFLRGLVTPLRTILTPDGWKLTVDTEGRGELYNLKADPSERVNLFQRPEQRARVARLTEKIRLWQRATGDRAALAGVK